VSKPADAMHKYMRDLSAVKPQFVLEIRHFSRDRGGGGQAAQVRRGENYIVPALSINNIAVFVGT